jgi:hypothetical protein
LKIKLHPYQRYAVFAVKNFLGISAASSNDSSATIAIAMLFDESLKLAAEIPRKFFMAKTA